MAWYSFASKSDFKTWHENIKVTLGLPKLSVNIDGDEVLPMVTDYTTLIESFGDNRLVAWVDDELAEGLTQTEKPNYETSRFGE